jgi:hypothetical protein
MSQQETGLPAIGISDSNTRTLTASQLLFRTYSIYHKRFWTFFRMALLPAVLAYCFSYGWRMATRWAIHHGGTSSQTMLAVLGIVSGWGTGAAYWTISAFFFGAIAANIAGTNAQEPYALSDAYTPARARLAAIAKLALLTWTLFWIGRAMAGFALFQFIDYRSPRNYWLLNGLLYVMLLLLAGLLSRFGLAIPELIRDANVPLRQAIRHSLKRTENWEPFFILFLAKSAIAGYCIYLLAGSGMDWLWQRGVLSDNLFFWVEWLVYICIAAVLEPPLFIAFSLLHRGPQPAEEEAYHASAG